MFEIMRVNCTRVDLFKFEDSMMCPNTRGKCNKKNVDSFYLKKKKKKASHKVQLKLLQRKTNATPVLALEEFFPPHQKLHFSHFSTKTCCR